MAGYLDHYGEGEERRAKIIKYGALSLVTLLVVGGLLYFWFKNYRQERQVRNFLQLLAGRDYKAAYALWGCTDQRPCPDYSMDKFMEDWGPGDRDPNNFKLVKSRSCGSGVIITVDTGKDAPERLWVQRQDLTLGFSPYPGCPPGR